MNYRHAFHAGNFADLVKHAALLQVLDRLSTGPGLTVIDTHAGRGLYELDGPDARRSGEAEAGIAALMLAVDAPPEFASLKAAVRELNSAGAVTRYPGSPWLIAKALRAQDRYLACELNVGEHAVVAGLLRSHRNVRTACRDGYDALIEAPATGRVLALIDPPFERADDYARVVTAFTRLRARNVEAMALAWLPLKDLETFDGFLRDLEDEVAAPLLVAETRIRPLDDPMRMNGCALVFVGELDLERSFAAICGWIAQALGAGGGARIYRLPSR